MAAPAPSPEQIDWSRLSDRALETAATIGVLVALGRTYAEVAELLGVSKKTVMNRVAELRAEIRAAAGQEAA